MSKKIKKINKINVKAMAVKTLTLINIAAYLYIGYELVFGPKIDFGLEVWKPWFYTNLMFSISIFFIVYPFETYICCVYLLCYLIS